jgi:hypothetical protein
MEVIIVIIVMIRMMTTLGTVIAAIVIRVTRPIGMQGDKDY